MSLLEIKVTSSFLLFLRIKFKCLFSRGNRISYIFLGYMQAPLPCGPPSEEGAIRKQMLSPCDKNFSSGLLGLALHPLAYFASTCGVFLSSIWWSYPQSLLSRLLSIPTRWETESWTYEVSPTFLVPAQMERPLFISVSSLRGTHVELCSNTELESVHAFDTSDKLFICHVGRN